MRSGIFAPSTIVKIYHRLARLNEGVNKTNRLRIALENRITPLELAALTADAGPDLDPPDPPEVRAYDPAGPPNRKLVPGSLARWCSKLNALAQLSGKTVPEPFLRRRIGPKTLFLSNGQDSPDKVLMLCFTSAARRMMMPMPVFFQHLDASKVDVIMFTDPHRDGFRRFFIKDHNPLVEMASKYADRKKYRGIVCLGTSGGGLPSVLVGLEMNVDAILSVCANSPYDIRWMAPGGEEGADLVKYYTSKLKGKFPDLWLVHPAEYDEDKNSAIALGELLSARLIAYNNLPYVEQTGEPIGHGVLIPMLRDGTISSLIDATILSRFTPFRNGKQEDWNQFLSGPTIVTE